MCPRRLLFFNVTKLNWIFKSKRVNYFKHYKNSKFEIVQFLLHTKYWYHMFDQRTFALPYIMVATGRVVQHIGIFHCILSRSIYRNSFETHASLCDWHTKTYIYKRVLRMYTRTHIHTHNVMLFHTKGRQLFRIRRFTNKLRIGILFNYIVKYKVLRINKLHRLN